MAKLLKIRQQVGRKLPIVFVGCPYDEKTFKFSAFKAELERLPWTCIFANTSLHTKHLLEKIKSAILEADFSLFDLSLWNSNVALELGLADGMGRKPYYILTNGKITADVPSDIKGFQRIEYIGLAQGQFCLRSMLVEHFFQQRFQPTRSLWRSLLDEEKSEKRFVYALQILAQLRDRDLVSTKSCNSLAGSLRLPLDSAHEVCELMRKKRLLVKLRTGRGFRLFSRQIFKRR